MKLPDGILDADAVIVHEPRDDHDRQAGALGTKIVSRDISGMLSIYGGITSR